MKNNFVIPVTVPYDRVLDLLCSAFEGGSSYWINEISISKEVDFEYIQEVPLKGGELKIKIGYDGLYSDSDEFILNIDTVTNGLNIFFSLKEGEGGHHAANFMKCQDDAETGDVFLQCCLFGKIIFL